MMMTKATAIIINDLDLDDVNVFVFVVVVVDVDDPANFSF